MLFGYCGFGLGFPYYGGYGYRGRCGGFQGCGYRGFGFRGCGGPGYGHAFYRGAAWGGCRRFW